ncbi:MAG: bifunctional demethylmenaquinone methyltransferase/2-methoxy-6-polyprenyl-1,4-benzoquinol methylase UbiE [Phycisphaerae bacterium]
MTRSNLDSVWDPAGLANPHAQADKAARVRVMFDRIAPTYERVNRVLSAGRDRYWRRAAVDMAGVGPNDAVLDVACGTGDFTRAFAAAGPALVAGCDFAAEMLALARRRDAASIAWFQADGLSLPFADESFTLVSCAFGVRNFQDLVHGLREFHRVLAPGGRAVILEFSMPGSRLLRAAYTLYFRRILPRVATALSGDRSGAYRYLPQSVLSFVDAAGMTAALRSARFSDVRQKALTGGIVTVHLARKDA